MFKNLKIQGWRQFEQIDIDFHPSLTLLTGANGAGKTSLLTILNQHFGSANTFVSTAQKDRFTGGLKFFSGLWPRFVEGTTPAPTGNVLVEIGKIQYNDGVESKISIPSITDAIYSISINSARGLRGLNISSNRPVFRYQTIQNIPTHIISKESTYNKYKQTVQSRLNGAGAQYTENYHIKEALISLATFGYGNQVVEKNNQSINIFEGFENILRIVLPPKLGFKSISIRVPEVILVTESGEFSLDAVSGGVASVIDLAWQIFLFDNGREPFVVTYDEPENHLHPEMQKSLLPNFLKAFPLAQFIVATHSPFIISSVPNSNVYVLDYNLKKRVYSIKLDNIEKSGSANDILRDVLGLDSTMPDWVTVKIDEIISKYSTSGISVKNAENFKNELKEIGLEKYVTNSLLKLIDKGTND